MSIEITIPRDLEHRSLPDRLRWWMEAYSQLRRPNLHLLAMLEEAAIEVELGQRTQTTYRGVVDPGHVAPPARA